MNSSVRSNHRRLGHTRPGHLRSARLLASVALAAMLGVALAACKTTRTLDDSTSAMAAVPPGDTRTDAWGERYRTNPGDPATAINYAHALRTTGQRAQAVAVLEQAVIKNPKDTEVLGAYGRALADVGNYQQALDVLGRAHTPDRPDWRILSVQGAVLDQMGRHEDAQRYYATALKIVPEEPSVLSNLGLSYALARDLPRAEATLRRAAARTRDPRVRQNLALVVGLQGRFAEAEQIAQADLPPNEAAANVAYLRQMLSRQNAMPSAPPPSQSWFAPARS